MSSRPLSRVSSLKESPDILDRLNKVGIRTTNDVLEADVTSLMVSSGLSLREIKSLVQDISEKLCPPMNLAADLYRDSFSASSQGFLPSGWATLDRALGGGLSVGSLTEICGTSGSGKTQLCLQICARTVLRCFAMKQQQQQQQQQLPSSVSLGLDKIEAQVVYYDLAGRVAAKRLEEMLTYSASSVLASHPLQQQQQPQLNTSDVNWLLRNILIKQPRSTQELLEEVRELETTVLQHRCQLVVIDSFSHLLRKDDLRRSDGSLERYTTAIAAALKRIAAECKCVVLMTNTEEAMAAGVGGMGVGSIPGIFMQQQQQQQPPPPFDEAATRGAGVGAGALDGMSCTYVHTSGPEWHHCITSRLILSHVLCSQPPGCMPGQGQGQGQGPAWRAAIVEKSPLCSGAVIPFQISTGGLVDY